jgi:hypothetical protein
VWKREQEHVEQGERELRLRVAVLHAPPPAAHRNTALDIHGHPRRYVLQSSILANALADTQLPTWYLSRFEFELHSNLSRMFRCARDSSSF